jgi:hypothetical protein
MANCGQHSDADQTALPILTYPAGWNGSICCDSVSFLPQEYSSRDYPPPPQFARQNNRPDFMSKVHHTQLSNAYYDCTGWAKRAQQNEAVNSWPEETESDGQSEWADLMDTYMNIAVIDEDADYVMKDVQQKLSSLDPANRMRAVHGLLTAVDNPALLKNMLELGISYEDRYFPPASTQQTPVAARLNQQQTQTVPQLVGAYPIHFAVHYKRVKCLEVLIEVGVNVSVKNSAGKMPIEIIPKKK